MNHFLSIDLGLHLGFACLNETGEIIFKGSKRVSNNASFKKYIYTISKWLLEQNIFQCHLITEGDKKLHTLVVKELSKNIQLPSNENIGAEVWRSFFKLGNLSNKGQFFRQGNDYFKKGILNHNEAEALFIAEYFRKYHLD